MTHVVCPSGYPLQPQQQYYSTDCCSNVDNLSTTLDDPLVYDNTMKQIVPGVSMQYTNVQDGNPIIQTSSIHGDSCSSVDSFNIKKKDLSGWSNTMKQILPRGVVQYTNVQVHNPIIQSNGSYGSRDTCYSDDSCSTTNEDLSGYYNTMKQTVPGGMYTNVHEIQTNSTHGQTSSCSSVNSFCTLNKDYSV